VNVVQLTRDSVATDDEIRAPHVVAAHLPLHGALNDLGDWIRDNDHLAAVREDETWLLRMNTRRGPAVARLTPTAGGELDVLWLIDRLLPLHGVGCLHLERECSGAEF